MMLAHHRTTLRLVLVDLKANYSGIYTCTVSNEFETLQESATLAVWPNGTNRLFTVVNASFGDRFSCLFVQRMYLCFKYSLAIRLFM